MKGIRMKYYRLLVVVLVFLVGCKAGPGEPCAKSEDCGAALSCFDFECVNIQEMKEIKVRRAKRNSDRAHCGNQYNPYNRSLNLCYDSGACTVSEEGKCIVGNEQDCLDSKGCRERGACGYSVIPVSTEFAGRSGTFPYCSPRNTLDCKAATECKDCVLGQDQEVRVGNIRCVPAGYAAEDGYVVIQENPYWQKVD